MLEDQRGRASLQGADIRQFQQQARRAARLSPWPSVPACPLRRGRPSGGVLTVWSVALSSGCALTKLDWQLKQAAQEPEISSQILRKVSSEPE